MQNQMPEADSLALWEKQSKNGKTYLSGVVKVKGEDFRVVAFYNDDKQGKQPEWSFKKKEENNYQNQ